MRIGIVSDIHEDIVRLREAIALLDRRDCDELVCLGDSVGYSVTQYSHAASRDARTVLALLRERCAVVLAGNHDLYAARKLPEHRAGIAYPDDWFDLPYSAREELLGDKVWLYERDDLPALIGPEDVAYLRSLPEFSVRAHAGVRVLYSHHAYPDFAGATLFEASAPGDASAHFSHMASVGCAIGISGHGHFGGLKLFTNGEVRELPFGPVRLTGVRTWVHGPAVVSGFQPNGVMILDTNTLELEAFPLGSPLRKPNSGPASTGKPE